MRLGFDIDEVMADIITSLLKFMYDKYKISRSISVFEKYGLEECRYIFNDKLNEEIKKQLRELVHSNTFLYGLRPIYGAIDSINALHSEGHSIYFITSRPNKNKKVTYDWFAKHEISYDDIVVTNGISKGDVVNSLDLDMFVDDHGDYLNDIMSVNKINTKLLLLDKPWNICYNNKKVKRVFNWNHILREINEYTKTSKK